MAMLSFFFVSVLFSPLFVTCLEEYVVMTKLGPITGLIDSVTINNVDEQFVQFLGIPYAEAPVGQLRFKKPVAKRTDFTTPYNATYFRPACPQVSTMEALQTSEDCLFLNIFAPVGITNAPTEKRYPVMAFLHGGAFILGSSNNYIADVISAYGEVIVVTLNYRLSILGFLSTGDESVPGNFGLWDQHLAFKWINSNIDSFQGDPESLTIFGESAGASCVLLHALYPGNKNIIKRVIAESGTPIPTYSNSNFFGKPNGLMAAEATQCSYEDLLSCLRSMSVEEIFEATQSYSFVPVYDGDFVRFRPHLVLTRNYSIPADVHDMFSSVELMIGVNSMESAMQMVHFWAEKLQLDYNTLKITKDAFVQEMVPTALKLIYERAPDNIPSVMYDAVVFQYTDPSQSPNSTFYRDMALRLSSDFDFFIPCVKTADFHASVSASKSGTYFYLLSARMSLNDFRVTPPWMTGADHGDAVYFIFGFSRRMIAAFQFPDTFTPTSEELLVSRRMMSMWTNFAKSGDPNQPIAVGEDSYWPLYTVENRAYIDFSYKMSNLTSNSHFGEPYTSFWLSLMPSIVAATIDKPEITTLPTTSAAPGGASVATSSPEVTTLNITQGPFSHIFHINSVTSDNFIIALIVLSSSLFLLCVILCAFAIAAHGRVKHVIK